jgi:hypothetical protein
MIAEVELYCGYDAGVMMSKLYGLHCACKTSYTDGETAYDANRYVKALLHDMYAQNSDAVTCPLHVDLRVSAKTCQNPDYAYQMEYEDEMYTVIVDTELLPKNFKDGVYFCSATMTVGRDFWFRPPKNNKLCDLLNRSKCRLVLNLLERTGDVVPRPLTLWQHWMSELRKTFMD